MDANQLGSFDATQVEPNQGGKAHPVGKYPAIIGNTKVVPNKENTGGMFRVTFNTQAGSIDLNYNLWNSSEAAVRISKGQLSALCHATGVFGLNFAGGSEGAELRNKQCMIEVQPQMEDGKPHPKGYVEVSRVYDIQGNEPGRAATASPQAGAAWGGSQQPAQNPAPAPSPAPQQWGGQQPQPGPAAPAPAPAPAPQGNAGWSQGPTQGQATPTPPWGNR